MQIETVAVWSAAYAGVMLLLFATSVPWLLRNSWETEPMPEGLERSLLESVSELARFDGRRLFIWRTGNSVANAAIINRDALIETLRAGRLGGVALDVHYQEPVSDDDELLKCDNVILTPRMAGSPRFNGLNDFEQLITGLARELAP